MPGSTSSPAAELRRRRLFARAAAGRRSRTATCRRRGSTTWRGASCAAMFANGVFDHPRPRPAADRLRRARAGRAGGRRGGHRAAQERGRPAAAGGRRKQIAVIGGHADVGVLVGRRLVAGHAGRRRAVPRPRRRPRWLGAGHLASVVAAEGAAGARCRRARSPSTTATTRPPPPRPRGRADVAHRLRHAVDDRGARTRRRWRCPTIRTR